MSLKKRLQSLELEAAQKARRSILEFESAQRALCCPLPPETTTAERDEAWRLLKAGQDALKVDIANQKPLGRLRDYAIGLHRKYGGSFAGEEFSNAIR